MTESRTICISIRCSPREVYDYLAEPTNFPYWSIFIREIRRDGDDWLATTSTGTVRIRFTRQNEFGVLDHHVMVTPELRVYVPMRVVANGADGSELLFTVFRRSDMSEAQFREDIAMVSTDLARLKRVLEKD